MILAISGVFAIVMAALFALQLGKNAALRSELNTKTHGQADSALRIGALASECAQLRSELAVTRTEAANALEAALKLSDASAEQLVAKDAALAAMSAAIERAKSVALNHLRQSEPEVVLDRVTPLVNAARELEVTGHQKRVHVMLDYLRQYPGTPTDVLEHAIEEALNGSRHSS